jgi:AraC family transcriptional regulator, transcriptional activator FtrA
MKKILLRILLYLGIFIILIGGVGVAQYGREQKDYWVSIRKEPIPSIDSIKIPEYNPDKPTVAVLLGAPTTEIFDFVVPYEMFVMTEKFNVFAVAPDKNVTSLTGGLDIIPHYSFDELDKLLGKSPDLLVVPYMPMGDEKKYKPVRKWIQKHSNTEILSICGGAGNLADAGLLKGKSATIHWQFFDSTKRLKPDTNWIRDQRYVVDGNIVGSAGLTSGIDAVLYVISQKIGEPMAEKIAKEINYPTYHFVKNPKVEDPYYIDHTEAIYLLNQAFQWNEKEMGVLLYNGMEDGALASIFDTYAAAGTSNVFTISESDKPIVTKHYLNLVPRYKISSSPKLDRMIVTGTQAKSLAKEDIKFWNENGNTDHVFYMHNDSDQFIFDATLEDLAKQEDILTAMYGQKRLEYRGEVALKGKPFSIEAFGNFTIMVLLSVLIAYFIDQKFFMRKNRW